MDNPDAGVRAANERIARQVCICMCVVGVRYCFILIAAVEQEWDWASHLGVQAALFPTPNAKHNNYARFLNQICHESSHLLLWIRIPIVSQAEFCARVQSAFQIQALLPSAYLICHEICHEMWAKYTNVVIV